MISPQNLLPALPDALPESQPTNENQVILVVEDSRDTAEMLGLFLESQGYRIVIAYDGEQAVKISLLEPPHLVIMDLGLPELNGLDASMEIRRRNPDGGTRFIALSGYDDRETVNRCMDFGFDAHITKPADPKKLLELIRSLI